MAPPPSLETIVIDRLSPGAVLFSYNQPKISNAFTLQQYKDLAEALLWAREDSEIRVVVQHVYSSPESLSAIAETLQDREGQALLCSLVHFPKVLIAAVHGAAIGWGCTQLYNFDLVYAYEKAVFQTPFMSLGFVPEGASSYTFPKAMGKQHANRLLLAAEKLSAEEMYVSGLVTQVLPAGTPELFLTAVCDKAKYIATFSAESLRMAKAQVNRPIPLAEQREAGIREGHDLKVRLNSDEAKAMMSAFANKSSNSRL